MTDIGSYGPVDYIVIEFPGNRFNGAVAPALADLVESGQIRILDLVFIYKDADGNVDAIELEELDDEGIIGALEEIVADLIGEDDIAAAAEIMEPNSSAGLLVYENLWAAPFATAVRESGGQLIASGRIPVNAILAAFEAEG